MSLLAPWLAFPALFAVLCLGAGLLVERAAGSRLPGQLLLPLGFAALVCVTQLTTFKGSTAEATVPLAVLVALTGYAVSLGRLRTLRPDPWIAGVALVVYGLFAAPALLWGSRTFLGYGNLGDAAVHFGIVDQLLSAGNSVAGLPESSFTASIGTYFQTAYPTGNHAVLATLRALVGINVAWVFQPFLTCLATLAVLGLEPLARGLTSDRRLAAAGAGVAASGGLVYGYAVNQEPIKELGAIAIIALLAALVAPLLRTPPSWRASLPLAVATGGGIGVLSFALAPWLGPLLLIAVIALVAKHWSLRRGALLAEIGAFVVVGLALAIPRIAHIGTFVAVNKHVLQSAVELGNLQRPLGFFLGFGVWPVDDFRSGMTPHTGLAIALTGAAVLACAFGVVTVWRRGAWEAGLFAAISLIGFLFIARTASPWAYGKSLMILTPALVLLAVAGVLGLRRAHGVILGAALLAGVLWTAALNYHGVDAAPQDRLDELSAIDARFKGQGPALFTEFDEYAKHFLRDLAPTGATEAFRPANPVAAPGANIRFGFSSDIDDWQPQSVADHYELLVLRQGPTRSRPPLGWDRVFHGRYYDVWKRGDVPQVKAHLRLGGRTDAAGDARCPDVRKLAKDASQLAYAKTPRVYPFVPTQLPPPANWGRDGGDPEVYRPVGPGRVAGTTRLSAGRYDVWAEFSDQRDVRVYVDDQLVATFEDHLNPRQSPTRLGTVTVGDGSHRVRIDRGGGSPQPGNGGFNRIIGPLYFQAAGEVRVQTIDASQWRTLCGRRLDWIQALA
jgi:hypothetical protein